MGRGGLQNRNGGGGEVKFYPYKQGGTEEVLAKPKGGTSFEVVRIQDT